MYLLELKLRGSQEVDMKDYGWAGAGRVREEEEDMHQGYSTWLCILLCCLSRRFSGVSATLVKPVLG